MQRYDIRSMWISIIINNKDFSFMPDENHSQHYYSEYWTENECDSHSCKYFSNISLFHTCELNTFVVCAYMLKVNVEEIVLKAASTAVELLI